MAIPAVKEAAEVAGAYPDDEDSLAKETEGKSTQAGCPSCLAASSFAVLTVTKDETRMLPKGVRLSFADRCNGLTQPLKHYVSSSQYISILLALVAKPNKCRT